MRLLELRSNGSFSLTKHLIDNIPLYAILSHTWGSDEEEVTFEDLINQSGENKAGYTKLQFCGRQAAKDGLQYFWVDTCCIDKSSSSELTEAINSMFQWYLKAAKCYVYLSDVSVVDCDSKDDLSPSFLQSRWFTRGWTLQELIAPRSVEFFSSQGSRLGDKRSMEQQIYEVTGIAVQALRNVPLSDFSVAERFSWAAKRKTTRKEDGAYSLLGIFDVFIPVIYGEGKENAFTRLRTEIERSAKIRSQIDPKMNRGTFSSHLFCYNH
jgi:Heterokaryon incompatibility protein (HET)